MLVGRRPLLLLVLLLLLLVRRPFIIVVAAAAVVVVVCLIAPRLFDGRALLDARVVALPLELRVGRERQDAPHCFAAGVVSGGERGQEEINNNKFSTYRILRTRCPFARAQMLRMSSPFRTLRTAPHTSSLASPNWSPIMASSRSSQ